ncbi:HAD hydrolase-like protein [Actinoplanes sp. TRM 88003]|uniref:HAD hydrolase-like protein n=1 Tax=Paractinoplanes aksuensis TaxID=2939490 RepID=A0ABT1DW61_9ACTN|nr:HAD family hydrolase [Actinoplanes aksuensis]MCO8275063.1 HAD hydrolase-like protein [Actinoplanes aksuensis]
MEAVVFDLLYTLVHPRDYPGGVGRVGWLAELLGVDRASLKARWDEFEPVLEAGRAPGPDPELTWLRGVTKATDLSGAEADWDLTRREALLNPPPSSVATLVALRDRGLKLGVLSNTHGLEMRAWPRSPLAPLVDVVAFSHEIGHIKPEPQAYAYVLERLAVRPGSAVYVGDGSNDELLGARAAGFGLVVLAEQAATPDALPRLRAQADVSVSSLFEVVTLV